MLELHSRHSRRLKENINVKIEINSPMHIFPRPRFSPAPDFPSPDLPPAQQMKHEINRSLQILSPLSPDPPFPQIHPAENTNLGSVSLDSRPGNEARNQQIPTDHIFPFSRSSSPDSPPRKKIPISPSPGNVSAQKTPTFRKGLRV